MPKSALPPKMRNIDFWDGTDNESWLMKLKKRVQYAFAAGPRVPSGFFKFRDIPKTLILFRGKGLLRYENTDGSSILDEDTYIRISKEEQKNYYISRIQPWIRWHFVLLWPLFYNWHFIYKKEDVIEPPKYKSSFGINKMITNGGGYKRDGDKVYWPTANAGGNFE